MSASVAESVLEVRDLRVGIRTHQGMLSPVDGVSFNVDRSEILGLVGESGSGKSLTALALMGLTSPPVRIVGGSIRLAHRELVGLSQSELRAVRGKEIALILQNPMSSLNPLLPVGTQIAEVLQAHKGLTRRQARDRVDELLSEVGIPRPRESWVRFPHEFSGGMRQRILIAIALSCEPSLLIADEPTTALDVTIQAQILELLGRICRERRMAMIFITHDLSALARIADRVVVMYAGKIVEVASADAIFMHPRHPYTVGLLDSIPRLDLAKQDRLQAIRGAPPTVMRSIPGCPFEQRCDRALEQCRVEFPPLSTVSIRHDISCWNPHGDVSPTGGRKGA